MSDEMKDVTLDKPELRNCPYCEARMYKWYTPNDLSWGTPHQYVCFNDECSYYVRGWEWMESQYQKKASYRHRFNPFAGDSGPVPVWSQDALKARIMDDDEDVADYLLRTGKLSE